LILSCPAWYLCKASRPLIAVVYSCFARFIWFTRIWIRIISTPHFFFIVRICLHVDRIVLDQQYNGSGHDNY
jgi:hypothetical protein